eukprot:3480571-Amphidinium_carterae.1
MGSRLISSTGRSANLPVETCLHPTHLIQARGNGKSMDMQVMRGLLDQNGSSSGKPNGCGYCWVCQTPAVEVPRCAIDIPVVCNKNTSDGGRLRSQAQEIGVMGNSATDGENIRTEAIPHFSLEEDFLEEIPQLEQQQQLQQMQVDGAAASRQWIPRRYRSYKSRCSTCTGDRMKEHW